MHALPVAAEVRLFVPVALEPSATETMRPDIYPVVIVAAAVAGFG
jgi:hypothetical protein